jgi:ABC-type glycerol-3-phosphate transport system permease component
MQMNATQLNYWQQHLENAPAMLSLPTDKQRQGMANPQTAVLNTQLPTQLVPSATHLLAAYALLLLHHSQQDDGVVGTAVAHQLLPLRVTISPQYHLCSTGGTAKRSIPTSPGACFAPC